MPPSTAVAKRVRVGDLLLTKSWYTGRQTSVCGNPTAISKLEFLIFFFFDLQTRILTGVSPHPDVLDLIHCRFWMAAAFGLCQALTINNLETITAVSLAFFHWYDRNSELRSSEDQL